MLGVGCGCWGLSCSWQPMPVAAQVGSVCWAAAASPTHSCQSLQARRKRAAEQHTPANKPSVPPCPAPCPCERRRGRSRSKHIPPAPSMPCWPKGCGRAAAWAAQAAAGIQPRLCVDPCWQEAIPLEWISKKQLTGLAQLFLEMFNRSSLERVLTDGIERRRAQPLPPGSTPSLRHAPCPLCPKLACRTPACAASWASPLPAQQQQQQQHGCPALPEQLLRAGEQPDPECQPCPLAAPSLSAGILCTYTHRCTCSHGGSTTVLALLASGCLL